MSLPAQVRQQIENANKLQEQLMGKTQADPEQPKADETNSEVKAEEVVAEKPAEQAEQVRPQEKPATPANEDENSATYAQRWRSLQGVNNSLMQRINSLEALVASMNH